MRDDLDLALQLDRAARERQHYERAAAIERQRAIIAANGRTCVETTGWVGGTYMRCGAPAVVIVQHRGRTEGAYAMCYPCADHNLRNRNAGVVEWLDKELEAQSKGRYRPL